MSQLKFNCSHCGQRLECEDQFGGSQISCPTCKKLTLVPAAAAKASPAMPKSGMTFVPESWGKPPSQPGAK
jgi:DNA-directed RNA polymerase subunit RPC12/RpoP